MTNSIIASTDDIIYTNDAKVSCQGNGPASGHPLIYLNFGDKKEIQCPYCSCTFVRKTAE